MGTITYLTKIQFEVGASGMVQSELELLGVKRPLIITDKGIAAVGLLDQFIKTAKLDSAVPVFDGTPENPTELATLAARDAFKAAKCDSIIAVGGGSSLDLAKAAALLVTHPEPLSQYAAILGGTSDTTREARRPLPQFPGTRPTRRPLFPPPARPPLFPPPPTRGPVSWVRLPLLGTCIHAQQGQTYPGGDPAACAGRGPGEPVAPR